MPYIYCAPFRDVKNNSVDYEGTLTLNLWIRSPAPYPLGHTTDIYTV